MNILTKQYPTHIRVFHHILFWMVLLLFNVSRFQKTFVGYTFETFYTNLLSEIFELPVLILASYFTGYYLLQHHFIQKKYLSFFLWLITSAIFFALLLRSLIYFAELPLFYPDYLSQYPNFFHFNIFQHIFYIYTTVGIFFTIRLVKHLLRIQQSKSHLERQNMKSELALLRTQVNPHFLFNTLNNINTLVKKDPDKANQSIIKLSGIMRYMLFEAQQDRVLLENELEHLESYIDLQRIRLENEDYIDFKVEGNPAGIEIPPMLFIPFVENMFKHGSKSQQPPAFYIYMKITGKAIIFKSENPVKTRTQHPENDHGIGIQNVKRRLEMLYPDRHLLEIHCENAIFKVYLRINIHAH
ncbi:MAG: sensor histidine kinase [Bacteroidales bacterium]